MTVLYEMEGLKELDASVNRMSDNVSQEMQLLAKQCGQVLYTSITMKTPVVTGALRASISIETEETPNGVDIIAGTSQVYAAAVEFGYEGRRPHPYMRTGFEEARPVIEQMIAQGIEGVLQ